MPHAAPVSPVFLAGAGRPLTLLRGALAAHPHFFTSHLPCDEASWLESWAEGFTSVASSRRPVWLSNAAIACRQALLQRLPRALFVCVVPHGQAAALEPETTCLTLDADEVLHDPRAALERVLRFLGECTPGDIASCA